jgi:hypothetical protein
MATAKQLIPISASAILDDSKPHVIFSLFLLNKNVQYLPEKIVPDTVMETG